MKIIQGDLQGNSSPGARARAYLYMTGNVADVEQVVVGTETYEAVERSGADEATQNNDFVTATPTADLTITGFAAKYSGLDALITKVGDLILIEAEFMRLKEIGIDYVWEKGVCGSTAASHANGLSITAFSTTAGVHVVGLTALTPAVFTDALVATVNERSAIVTAMGHSDDEVVFASKILSAAANAYASTTDITNASFSAATFTDGEAGGEKRTMTLVFVPTALEVITGNIWIPVPFTPKFAFPYIKETATGARLAWGGGILITDSCVRLDNDGNFDWDADNTISLYITE